MELPHFHYDRFKKGIALFLVSYLFIALTYTFSRLASASASVSEMVFFRNLVGVLLAFPWMIKHYPESFKVARLGLVCFRSMLGMTGIVCVFFAVKRVSLVDVTLLSNTAPLFVPLIGKFFLKKPIEHGWWPPIIIGFVGVGLILLPTKGIFDPFALFALGNGLTTAATLLVVRMATKTEKMHTLLFYYYLIGFIAFLPINYYTMTMPDWLTIIELIAVGLFAYYGSAISFRALQYAKAAQLAPFSYSGVVFAMLIQWFVWGTVPSGTNLVGIFLTCLAGIYILIKSKPPPEHPKPHPEP